MPDTLLVEILDELPGYRPGDIEEDEFLYHVTSRPNAKRILKSGFVANASPLVGRGGGYEAHSRGRVFFTSKAGLGFWTSRVEDHLFDQYDDPPPIAVLRIPRTALEEHLVADELGTRDARAPAYFVPAEVLKGRIPLAPTHEQEVARDRFVGPLGDDSGIGLTALHRNSHHGQHDLTILAHLPDGTRVGFLDYTLYDNELRVEMVEVEEAYRRQGIATRLYERMLEEHPKATLGRAGALEDGAEFRRAFDVAHADRLTPPEPERPEPFSPEEWAQATLAWKKAVARHGRDSIEASKALDVMNAMSDYDSAVSALPLRLRGVELPVRPEVLRPKVDRPRRTRP